MFAIFAYVWYIGQEDFDVLSVCEVHIFAASWADLLLPAGGEDLRSCNMVPDILFLIPLSI
jgi:hypothetical protein